MKRLLSVSPGHCDRRQRVRRDPTARPAPRQLRVPLQVGGVVPELLDPGLQDLDDRPDEAGEPRRRRPGDGHLAARPDRDGPRACSATFATGSGQGEGGRYRHLPRRSIRTAARRRRTRRPSRPTSPRGLAAVVAGMPNLKHVIVGNEPQPQPLLPAAVRQRRAGRRRDRLRAAAGENLRRGQGGRSDGRGARRRARALRDGQACRRGRDTHSPAQFILDMGAAYRALKRIEADHGRIRLPPVHGAIRPAADPAARPWQDPDDRRLRKARLLARNAPSTGRRRRDRYCRSSTTSSVSRRRCPPLSAPPTAGANRQHTPRDRGDAGQYYARASSSPRASRPSARSWSSG